MTIAAATARLAVLGVGLGQDHIEGVFWLYLLFELRLVLVLVSKLDGLSCCHKAGRGNWNFVHCLVCLVFVINFAIQSRLNSL